MKWAMMPCSLLLLLLQPAGSGDPPPPATETTHGAVPYTQGGAGSPPPRSPPPYHPCIRELREHCANATATTHAQCRAAVAPQANCTDAHIHRFLEENCSQWASEGGLLDIHLFGGVGDGKADNIWPIRRAVNATRACGGSVKFPTGRYLVSETIELARDSEWGGRASFVGVGTPPFLGGDPPDRYSFVAYNTGPTALIMSNQKAGPVVRIGEVRSSCAVVALLTCSDGERSATAQRLWRPQRRRRAGLRRRRLFREYGLLRPRVRDPHHQQRLGPAAEHRG